MLTPMGDPAPHAPSARRALASVQPTGATFVVAEAARLGFSNGHPDWANLAQGQPESGPIEGAPSRVQSVELEPEDHAAGPVAGIEELRDRIASHYNRLYRKGRASLYEADNVAVVHGGRLAIARALAPLVECRVGFTLPDAAAHEDIRGLGLDRQHAIPVRAPRDAGFRHRPATLFEAVDAEDLSALLLANPANPTGDLLEGDDLAALVAGARQRDLLLLLDESASHYVYTPDGGPAAAPVSAAAFVEDVDRDPVLLFDGLGRNFRYPGWRLGWIVGPRELIEAIRRSSSTLDGGASRIAQRAALAVLDPADADRETHATRVHFAKKRRIAIKRLSELGIAVDDPPRGGFAVWGSLANLPPPFDDSMTFFRKALQQRVLTVPGRFFDVGNGADADGEYRRWMRFSFAPPVDQLRMGLDRLARMLRGD
jgi:aspartate/methionine/tyrosine aminotransferase